MSVWKSETHKVSVVEEVYRISPALVESIFGNTLGPYLNPDETTSGLTKDSIWEDLAVAAGWAPDSQYEDAWEDLEEYLRGTEAYLPGTPGVYRLFSWVAKARFRASPQLDYDKIDQVLHTFGQYLTPSTQVTPAKFLEAYVHTDADSLAKARVWEAISESFKRLRLAFNRDDYVEINQKHYFGEGRRDATLVRAGRLLFIRGTQELTNTCLILTRAHLDQVIGCSQRIANIFEYLSRSYRGQDLDNALSYVQFTIETAGKASLPNSYKVSRAFHKARGIMQMEILRSVLPESIASEIDDYRADNLDGILRLSVYQNLLRQFKLTKRVEMLHVYKWMPSPDFDATRVFGVVRAWHHACRPSGADPGASDKMKSLWKRVQAERSFHLAHVFHRMTSQWPAALPHRLSGPTVSEASSWDYNGLLPYYQLGKDIASQVKDKQTVAASKDEELNGRPGKTETSYLLWYMENRDKVNTEDWLKAFPGHGEDNFARVAYKPESHKPDSRLFFMAPPKTRTLLGELEGNLSNIARFYPGCLMGKSASEKQKILLDIMDPYSKIQGVDQAEDFTVFVIQFDLSKFSPKSNFNVTADYNDFWAEVFGMPDLKKLKEVGCHGKLIHTTCGLKMEYDNQGADLEGFRGRLMTMFHADMLGAACRYAREQGYIMGRSRLGVFVDDGVVKVAAKGLGKTAVENVRAFLNTMKDVYASAGQDAHPSKTCVSEVGGEMLAEFYCHSTRLPSGIKAAMRMYPDYESNCTTIPEEFDALFATSQGAVKDGADWASVHAMYVAAALKCINRWARNEFSTQNVSKLALKLMTPKSYGGFGIQPLQGLVTTAVTNMTAEGLAMLNRAARAIPGARQEIIRIVTMPVIRREPLSILRDPCRIRADTPVLMENRLIMACVDWLEMQAGAIGEYMLEYSGESLREHATKVAEALLAAEQISLPVLERAWKSTPLCQVEQLISKFKRSSTVIKMIGREGVSRIRSGNRADLRRVLAA